MIEQMLIDMLESMGLSRSEMDSIRGDLPLVEAYEKGLYCSRCPKFGTCHNVPAQNARGGSQGIPRHFQVDDLRKLIMLLALLESLNGEMPPAPAENPDEVLERLFGTSKTKED